MKARASKFQEIQVMNLNLRKLYLMFGLEKNPNPSMGFAHGWFRMILGVIPMFCFGILRIFGGNRKNEEN